MKKSAVLTCLCGSLALGARFHIDPAGGDIGNDGSAGSPWSTLEEVFAQGRIQSRKPAAYPYAGGPLETKNPGAPVKPGDTLVLRDGYHGSISASEYYNSDYITVTAEEGHSPRLASLVLRSVAKWRIQGLHISASFAPRYERTQLLAFGSHGHSGASRDCIVEGCILFSAPDISSWTAEDWNARACNGIQLSGNRMRASRNALRNVRFGISASGDSSLVEYNVVENFSGDGLRGLGDYQLFQYNLVKNCYDVDDNHDDGFQSWSSGPGGVGTGEVVGMVLRGNTIINNEDPDQRLRGTLQGIGCFDGLFRDWVVENNVIVTDHYHGLTLLGAVDSRVVNNTVIDINSSAPGPAWIRVDAHKDGRPPQNCLVANNLAASVSGHPGVEERNNVILGFSDYGMCFVDFPSFDLRLKAGCPAIGAADAVAAPALDMNGISRPQGGGTDAGAYEFPFPQGGPAIARPAAGKEGYAASPAGLRDALGREIDVPGIPDRLCVFPGVMPFPPPGE